MKNRAQPQPIAPARRACYPWALVCLMVACCPPLAACTCSGRLQRDKKRVVVAQVGDMPIFVDELEREYARVRLDGDEGGATTPSTELNHKRVLLNNLITAKLLLRAAEQHNVFIGSPEVDLAFDRLRRGWGDEEFDKILSEKDLTPAELKTTLRDTLVVNKYLRDHLYARLAATQDEIDAYVATHPEVTRQPAQVHARQILLTNADKAQSVAKEIAAGLPFDEAAMKYSISPDAQTGGDLGFFAKGAVPEYIENICFNLRPGDVSPVVPSSYGFHLFQALERRPEAELSPAAVHDKVDLILRQEKQHAAREQLLTELRASHKIEIMEDRLAQMQ